MSLPITSLVAGILAILMVPLSFQISLRRVKLGGIVFGHGDDEILRRRVRAHGNFIEYVPLGVIAIALVEGAGAATALVWALGGGFLLSRLLHAWGMLYVKNPAPRAAAMMINHAVFLIAGGHLLVTFTL